MKFIVKLFFVVEVVLLSIPLMAQDTQHITLSFQNIPLKEVLSRLEDEYNLKFSYSEDLVELSKYISVRVDDASLHEFLQLVFSKANLDYKWVTDQIVIREKVQLNSTAIHGRVVDSITGAPLPFASVRIAGTAVGTATNSEGIFTLTIPANHQNEKLIISYVGYKNQEVTVNASVGKMIFRMEEDSISLHAVVVTAKTGSSILGEAISRIKQNYDTSAVHYTYFIRDVSLLDGVPVGASEVLYEAYRGSVNTANTQQQVKFRSGRKIKNFKAVQSILQTFIRWTGFELGFTGNVIFSGDLAAKRDNGYFPSSAFMTQHTFELLGVSQLDGKEVYIIDFDQKPGQKKSLYKGRFYIETESLAFARIEIGLSPQGIEQARFFNTPKAMAALFGYGKCAVTDTRTVINFKVFNEKWYPATIEEYWSADLVQPRKDFYSTMEVRGNIVITDIQTENVSPFTTNEVLADDYRNWEYLHRSDASVYSNTIETDTDIQDAFLSIAKKNKEQGIDMKFWKRYQPYRRDPSLLIRDSIRCQRAEISDAAYLYQIPYQHVEEDIALTPRYPSLDRTFYTKHFVLHYLQQDSSAVYDVSQILENNYDRVLAEFQLKNLDTSVHVEIYPDIKHYHFAIGNFEAPQSDAGMAVDMNLFKMVSPENPGTYHTKESLLKAAVHEFAHCVHYHFIDHLRKEERTRINNSNEAPWLFEAMASYIAQQFYSPARFEYMQKKQYPTVQQLNDVEGDGKIYDIGFVIIDFIKQKWGQGGLISLLKSNGNVHETFNVSEHEFEADLYRYIETKYITDQK